MNNPEYIHFMVNPAIGSIAVVPCDRFADDALKITCETGTDCELYSKSLTRRLSELNPQMENSSTYRIYGAADESTHIVIFDINKMNRVDSFSQE